MKKYVIPAIALLALTAFGLAACGDDDNTSTKTSTAASNATTATNSGNGQSGGKASSTSSSDKSATSAASQEATKDPGSGQVTGSGADALKKLSTDISKKTYSVSYEMEMTDADGTTQKGTMSYLQKPPKTVTVLEQPGDAGTPGSVTLIDDGKNSYTCFKDPSSGKGQCLKAASSNAGQDANFGLSLNDVLKNLSEDIDVTETDGQNIAGQDSRCFRVKTSDGDGTACFSKKDGIATLYDGGSSDNSKIKLKATKVTTSVDDSAFDVPKGYDVVDPSSAGGGG